MVIFFLKWNPTSLFDFSNSVNVRGYHYYHYYYYSRIHAQTILKIKYFHFQKTFPLLNVLAILIGKSHTALFINKSSKIPSFTSNKISEKEKVMDETTLK